MVVLIQRLQGVAAQVWLKVPAEERSEFHYFGYPAASVKDWLADDAMNLALHSHCNAAGYTSEVMTFTGNRTVNVLPIGDVGCLFIESRLGPMPASVFSALNALMPRLAVSCKACLTHANNVDLLELTRSQNMALEAARERLELEDRMKSEFLAAISHDMRTPLNGIIGFSDLLTLELEGSEQAEHARNINAAGRQLNAMFKDLLDLAKLDSHRLVLYPEEIDVELLLAELARPFAAQAQKKGLGFRVALGHELPKNLIADPVRLRQILNNLVANAIKYTNHGQVELRLELPDADCVAFVVVDSGIGIPEDSHQLVFERFRQVSHEGRRPHEGTGLGLAIAADLAALMGGAITLKSTPGLGSTFVLKLPRRVSSMG